ncbi:MAG: family 16 glycosylhydrolase [Ginsengibacter sp.]
MKQLQNKFSYLVLLLLNCFLLSCKKSGADKPEVVVPSIKVANASQSRSTVESVMHVQFTLNKTTTIPVSVDYTLKDGTAIASKDYAAASGTITIPANKTMADLTITIKGDPTNTRQANLTFNIVLSNPKNCTIASGTAQGTIITEDGTNLETDNSGYSTPMTYPGYQLVWSDEFSGNKVDETAWNFEIGNGDNGWGNRELEYYTNSPKNVFVSNGNLIIEARKETISGFNYTSTRMTTQNKKAFTFGRIDIRAKLPVAKGMWPALWMLGSNISSVSWPACGEIDIMELIGTNPNTTHSTLHWGASTQTHASKGAAYTLPSGDFSQQFHVFSAIWVKDSIKFLVDDHLYLTVSKTDVGTANYPFNDPQFFIFNVAVGGDWPGPPDNSTSFPQRMFVDYVRVFQ